MSSSDKIINIKDIMFLFDTYSKRHIVDTFKWLCHTIYDLAESELKPYHNYLHLPIDLEKWLDIDNERAFENVLPHY